MDANPSPSPPAKRSLVGRILRWLFLIVGAVAAIWALVYWVTVVQLSPALNPWPRGVGEWGFFILAHVWAIAFVSYLPLTRRVCRYFFAWRTMRRTLVGSAILATLLAIFYAEEDWRGKRTWEQCKRDLEAKGEVLDWAAYIPAPIPDHENIFKSPMVAEWFVRSGTNGQGNALSVRLGKSTLPEFARRRHPRGAEVTRARLSATNLAADADLVFRCRYGVVSVVSSNGVTIPSSQSSSNLSRIEIKEQPLSDAIKILARVAGLDYQTDPGALLKWEVSKGGYCEPNVTVVWENLSALEAFFLLLDNWDLRGVENPQTGILHIVKRQPEEPRIYVETEARMLLQRLMDSAFASDGKGWPTHVVEGSQGLRFVVKVPEVPKPVHLTVLSDDDLRVQDIEAMLPSGLAQTAHGDRIGWRGEHAGGNTFFVFPGWNSTYAAADYLAWSDQFSQDFELIREALKRPHARIDGDYRRPFEIPMIDFVNPRSVAQIAAQRAQCCLLLGRSEQALHELALIFDLRRLVASKPVTLVSAMIDVAFMGLSAEVIADGFRLRAWGEPELVMLQPRLAEVRLVSPLAEAFRTERAATSETLGKVGAAEMARVYFPERQDDTFWKRARNPIRLLVRFAPRGWVDLNLAAGASLWQHMIEVFDTPKQIIEPRALAQVGRKYEEFTAHWSPKNVLAAIVVPNFVRAPQTAARNQTKVNQALVVCGLERYRLAHGGYPESLDLLEPEFVEEVPADVIGGQPLRYRRTSDGQFVLYSVGWDEKDDGGQVVLDKDGKPAQDQKDWVWTTAAK